MQKNRQVIKTITTTAMLIAISIIIGIFCKSFLNFGEGLLRITFENLPIIMAGILYGPIIGGVTGLATDIISYFLSGQAFPIMPVVTLGSVMVGVVSGVVSKYIVRKKGTKQIIISGAFAHLVGSMIIKPIGLYTFYNILVLIRIPLYLVIAPIEIALLCMLLNRKSFARVVGYTSNEKMTYDKAIEYIHSVSWTFCKPGLERITELCNKLGNPQKSLKFIHVAGTNGKGSFCSMLSSVLASAGYKTGVFTSPYIKVFNERIAINGKMISNYDLAKITEKIKPIADSMKDKPTEFELITAIGFEYFRQKKCDYVVLECGLGGRLDSTNIIENSILSVITGIALDHTSILGDTISKIASEKAGIIKENTPVLWCGNDLEAREVIQNEAKGKNAPFYEADRSTLKVKNQTLKGTFFDFDGLNDLKISLLGTYQIENATNVLNAIQILKSQGIEISNKAIYDGLASAKWHARYEVILDTPLMIFDGGHNPQGVCEAVKSTKLYLNDQRLHIITGVMADKDYEFIASQISQIAKCVYTVTPNNPRALSAIDYAEVFKENGIEAQPCGTVNEAVAIAIAKAKEDKAPILCLGSLYMYGEIVNAVNNCKTK